MVGNTNHDNRAYCLAIPDQAYLVYVPYGGKIPLDLRAAPSDFRIRIFNPRTGEAVAKPSSVVGGGKVELSAPDDTNDWLFVLQKQ